MPARQATTIAQRQEMLRLVEKGYTYASVAEQVGVSFWTARKWIRIGKKYGVEQLASCYGRPRAGPLAGFAPQIKYKVLRLKKKHPGWGAEYVLKKLQEDQQMKDQKLPSAMTIWRYWRSFGERLFRQRDPSQSKLQPAEVPHGVWQMDAKESMHIPGDGRVTVLHRVHAEGECGRQMARMTGGAALRDCRIAFTEWGLPAAIQTDRDTIYVDSGPSPFPNRIVLWWVGLGIEHRLIPRRTPKRNGTVERSHRTLKERTLENQAFESATELQKRVDADWRELNQECPSRAKGCQGQPPLVAHPELLTTKRPYRPEWERELFDLQRVDAYLAEFTWTRTCTSAGQIRVRKVRYTLGTAWAHQEVSVTFDPAPRQFVFTQIRAQTRKGKEQPQLEPVRRAAQNLSVADITGIARELQALPTRQLMFPFAICHSPKNLITQGA